MNRDLFIIRLNRVDLLTLSGVITTSLAIAAALAGHAYLATALLFIAMLGDALDGMWARHRGITRHFGRYLDGFLDTLIYLVAPALVLYTHGINGADAAALVAMVMAGCIRLAVFNDIGNIREGGQLAYLGMPVFWSVFILGGFLLLEPFLPGMIARALLAATLVAFSVAMLLNRPFFKFRALWQVLTLTLGGAVLFGALHLAGRAA